MIRHLDVLLPDIARENASGGNYAVRDTFRVNGIVRETCVNICQFGGERNNGEAATSASRLSTVTDGVPELAVSVLLNHPSGQSCGRTSHRAKHGAAVGALAPYRAPRSQTLDRQDGVRGGASRIVGPYAADDGAETTVCPYCCVEYEFLEAAENCDEEMCPLRPILERG